MALARLSPQTLLVLTSLFRDTAEWRYGYDLSKETGLKSGTLYPILMRLAETSLLETRWEWKESMNSGRPPRHMYRLTSSGIEFTQSALRKSGTRRVLKPAYGER